MNHGTVTNKRYDISLGVSLGMQMISDTPYFSRKARLYLLEIDGTEYFTNEEMWERVEKGDIVSFEIDEENIVEISKN